MHADKYGERMFLSWHRAFQENASESKNDATDDISIMCYKI